VPASDHRHLRPWRFVLIEGEAREKLGQVFVDSALEREPDLSAEQRADIAGKTLRAPLIIAVVARVRPNPKVPDIEQLLSAGGAAQLMLVAAHAQGFGGIWRTGGAAYDALVRRRLGLEEGDQIVGFLYLGTPQAAKKLADIDYRDYTVSWNG
jgi:nitroreductase